MLGRPVRLLVSAAMCTVAMSACSGPPEFEYTCNGDGRSASERLASEVASMPGVRGASVVDSCDSGDPLYVQMDIIDESRLSTHLTEVVGCRPAPSDASTQSAGPDLLCPFATGNGEFRFTAEPPNLLGYAEILPPE